MKSIILIMNDVKIKKQKNQKSLVFEETDIHSLQKLDFSDFTVSVTEYWTTIGSQIIDICVIKLVNLCFMAIGAIEH